MGLLGKRKRIEAAHDHTLLMLEVPRTNDKKELAAEQMLAALHGILRPTSERKFFRKIIFARIINTTQRREFLQRESRCIGINSEGF